MKNILFPLKNTEQFYNKFEIIPNSIINTLSDTIPQMKINTLSDTIPQMKINTLSDTIPQMNINNMKVYESSIDIGNKEYINNMIKTQEFLKDNELNFEYILNFFTNKKIRYQILENYIKSNRYLIEIFKSNLVPSNIFDINSIGTQKLKDSLNKDILIDMWKKGINSVVDRDTIYKIAKYFNIVTYTEIDKWVSPFDIEVIAWNERKQMVSDLMNIYKEKVKNALDYISKNNIKDYYMNYTENRLDVYDFINREPVIPTTMQIIPIKTTTANKTVTFYNDCYYKKKSFKRGVGTYKLDAETLLKKISSIDIPPGLIVELYDSNKKKITLDKSIDCLKKQNWNDRAVKVIIKKKEMFEGFSNNISMNTIILLVIFIILIIVIYVINKNCKE
jgi:hypothetical protein